MWWNKKVLSKKTRREELTDTLEKLRRQLRSLSCQPVYRRLPATQQLASDIWDALVEIKKELDENEKDGAQP